MPPDPIRVHPDTFAAMLDDLPVDDSIRYVAGDLFIANPEHEAYWHPVVVDETVPPGTLIVGAKPVDVSRNMPKPPKAMALLGAMAMVGAAAGPAFPGMPGLFRQPPRRGSACTCPRWCAIDEHAEAKRAAAGAKRDRKARRGPGFAAPEAAKRRGENE